MTETWIDEEWVVSEDGRTATVTGRRRRDHPWSVAWFFENDLEPTPPAEYRPDDPHRVFRWYLRNPLQNFGRWVIGVCDRNYTVVGTAPVLATTWLDVPQDDERSRRCGLRYGWKFSVIKLGLVAPAVRQLRRQARALVRWVAELGVRRIQGKSTALRRAGGLEHVGDLGLD